MSSAHSTVTYTSEIDSDRPPFSIDWVPVYGYESDASKAAPQSPVYAPLSPEYAPPTDDDLEPTEAQALLAPVLPAPLSPDYSTDSEPIEDDPQEADSEDDPEEEPSEEGGGGASSSSYLRTSHSRSRLTI
ncbi:hypothetical protein Tco_0084058 [Tanacetum coccineum]